MTERQHVQELHSFLFYVIILFLFNGRAHCGIPFRPSFVSSPPRNISCNVDAMVTIQHNLNEVPVKVIAEVTVNIAGELVVFNAFGSAQRDPRTGVKHGGIVCLYNSTHVMVIAPSTPNGRLFYPGLQQSFTGPSFPDQIETGVVVVKVWREFDLPTPDYYKAWTNVNVNDNTTTFLELEHGIDGYPDLVVVQIRGDNSPYHLISEASGAISVFHTRASTLHNYYFGGVMFGYSQSHIRIWAPNQNLSTNRLNLFYVANGWGEKGFFIAETTGKIRIMAWKIDTGSKLEENKITTTTDAIKSISFSESGLPIRDNQLLLVQAWTMNPNLPNSGFRFTGIGSAMTEGQDGTYGGLVYGRTSGEILIWQPSQTSHESFKNTICIHNPWATESTKQCIFGGLEVQMTIYKLSSTGDVICYADETVEAFTNSTQSQVMSIIPMPAIFNQTLPLECQTGLVYISGDTSMYCSRDGKFVSDNPIVCSAVRCPDPTRTPNAHLQNISGISLGQTVTYTCNEGYTLENPQTATRTCQHNSTWSGELPVCKPVTCPSNMSVLFTSHTSTGNFFMDTVTYRCDAGFPHQGGDLIRTCLANGSWSGSVPVCEYCECPCSGENSYIYLNRTLAELLAALRAELKVDKKKTAIALRKKISVYEDKPLAKGLGSIGIVILVFVFAIIIIPDVPRLLNDIRFGFNNFVLCCRKTKPHDP